MVFRFKKVRGRTVTVVVGVAVALVVLAGAALGGGILSHGGPPSQVFMRSEVEGPWTEETRICPEDKLRFQPVEFGQTDVTLTEPGHIVAWFTWTTAVSRATDAELVLTLQLDGPDGWRKSPDWAFHLEQRHTTQTVMFPFQNLSPGTHTVKVVAMAGRPQSGFVEGTGPTLHSCALAGFVTPTVQ